MESSLFGELRKRGAGLKKKKKKGKKVRNDIIRTSHSFLTFFRSDHVSEEEKVKVSF